MILFFFSTLLVGYTVVRCLSLWNNVRAAKATGLPYVIIPFSPYQTFAFLLFSRTVLKLINRLYPEIPNGSWRQLYSSRWPIKLGYTPFAALKRDSFLLVSPTSIVFQTADANVIAQVVSRGSDFQKPIHIYRSIDVYGKNVVSLEGEAWRRHRKLLSPAFSEQNNQLVWRETIHQAQSMVASWLDEDGEGKSIHSLANDAMRLSLNVIFCAGFGMKMDWPKNGGFTDQNVPQGHELNLAFCLHTVLNRLLWIVSMPIWIMRLLPSKFFRECYHAYEEWRRYMIEMIAAKQKEVKVPKKDSTPVDLLGQILKGQERVDNDLLSLTDQEVMGNLFAMSIAGHETSANSIHFALLLLALNPKVQMRVQQDLETLIAGRPLHQWNYEHDFPRLINGMLGAVLSEQLRLISPVVNVPKITVGTQTLETGGRQISLPAGTILRLCVTAVHRNPSFWPHGPATDSKHSISTADIPADDLGEFKPERWMRLNGTSTGSADFLFTPPRGAFLAFSDGQRACLGKRFAQIEVLAALAVILSQHSVELAVEEWATDREVAYMSKIDKKAVWEKAEDKAHWILRNNLSPLITLQLRGAHVAIRLAKKGHERFHDIWQ